MPEIDDLQTALTRCEVQLNLDQIQCLERYCQLLWSWNERINLTRHTTYGQFVARDVVDSLALADLLELRSRVLDVGTGGGVPGIVLRIVRPDLTIALCESVGKKVRAVQAMVEELDLSVRVHHARVEELLEYKTFDSLVVRAVAKLSRLLGWLEPHWDAFDQLFVIKSQSWTEERGDARHRGLLRDLELRKASAYRTPGNNAENVVLQIFRKEKVE